MIRAIILDCFRVLYIPIGEDFYQAHIPNYQAHRAQLTELGNQADRGVISEDEYFAVVAKLAGMDWHDALRQADSGWVLNQALLDFSQTLRPQCKIGLLSNIGVNVMDRFFTQKEREKFFDDVVISSKVGLIKPQVQIFELAAKRLGVSPQECVMVDDDPINCSAAIQAGMRAVIYTSTQQIKRELTKILAYNSNNHNVKSK